MFLADPILGGEEALKNFISVRSGAEDVRAMEVCAALRTDRTGDSTVLALEGEDSVEGNEVATEVHLEKLSSNREHMDALGDSLTGDVRDSISSCSCRTTLA